jgi:hypothetical protein
MLRLNKLKDKLLVITLRRHLLKRNHLLFILAVLTVMVLGYNMLIFNGNDKVAICDVSMEKNNKLRTLLKTVITSLEKHNVTYWVDYGTALGAYRYCDVIPWDHDADICYLETDYKKVLSAAEEVRNKQGFKMNSFIASYGEHTLDLLRWRKVRNWWSINSLINYIIGKNDSAENFIMYVNMPRDNSLLIYFRNFFIEYFPFKFLERRSRIKIWNFEAYTLRNLTELVKWRYFLTYNKVVPYNTRCLRTFYNSDLRNLSNCQPG